MEIDIARKETINARRAGRLFPRSLTAPRDRRNATNDMMEPAENVLARGIGYAKPRKRPISEPTTQPMANIVLKLVDHKINNYTD